MLTFNDLAAAELRMSNAFAEGVSVEDHQRRLGLDPTAVDRFMAITRDKAVLRTPIGELAATTFAAGLAYGLSLALEALMGEAKEAA